MKHLRLKGLIIIIERQLGWSRRSTKTNRSLLRFRAENWGYSKGDCRRRVRTTLLISRMSAHWRAPHLDGILPWAVLDDRLAEYHFGTDGNC